MIANRKLLKYKNKSLNLLGEFIPKYFFNKKNYNVTNFIAKHEVKD